MSSKPMPSTLIASAFAGSKAIKEVAKATSSETSSDSSLTLICNLRNQEVFRVNSK
jgi:hypothetical protein